MRAISVVLVLAVLVGMPMAPGSHVERAKSTRPGCVDAIGTGEAIPPAFPSQFEVNHTNGIAWIISLASSFTDDDSIWIESRLENRSGTRILMSLEQPITAEITFKADRRTVSLPIVDGLGLQAVSYNKYPEPSEVAHRFKADLRAYFGKLPPGEYSVQLVLAPGAYAISSASTQPAAQTLRSSAVPFNVSALDAGQIGQKFGAGSEMIKRLEDPRKFPEALVARGRFTNSTDKPLWIVCKYPNELPAVPEGQAPPLYPAVRMIRLGHGGDLLLGPAGRPPRGASDEQNRRTPAPLLEVKPNASVDLELPDWQADGGGMYVYTIDVYLMKDGGRNLFGRASSKPFTILAYFSEKNK
jgi:hypothetical protein